MPLTDNRIFTLVTDLAACLCAQINDEENGLAGVCFCGVVPGEAAPIDYASTCDDGVCGVAYVRMLSLYPSATVGMPNEQPGNCGVQTGVDIEVGIMRCFPMGEADELPTEADLMDATRLQIADAMALQRAVNCCPSLGSKDFILGPYVPAGPLGGVYGGTISLAAIV